jgi:hypothetical protein
MLVSLTSWAHDLDMKTYLEMQEALAQDNLKLALSAHEKICEKELIHYKDDYKNCKKNFKDISDLRNSFKLLSKVFIENGNKEELKKLMTAECSMAKAKWVQVEGAIKNPYYGKSMLSCGQKM